MKGKIVITCAITGGVHTPSMSPYLPITPDEIATSAIEAAEAGAAILHMHARNPENGKPVQDPDLFMQTLPRIKQATDAILNVTTGGGLGMSMDERLAPAHRAKPELASLNMGSMNFDVSGAAKGVTEWKYDWEKPYLESTWGMVYPNTFDMLKQIALDVGRAHGTRFEFECFELGHLYNLKLLADRGLVDPPFMIQGIFGVSGGMGGDFENLMVFKQTADRLFGDNYRLSAFGIGRKQMHFLTMSALLGGNVRVGLEDSLFIGKGELAVSNAQQVEKIRRIVEELGFEVATPDEARADLKLKGGDNVAF